MCCDAVYRYSSETRLFLLPTLRLSFRCLCCPRARAWVRRFYMYRLCDPLERSTKKANVTCQSQCFTQLVSLSVQEGAEKRETGNSSTDYLTHYCTPCSGHWPLRICAVHYSILNLSNSIRAAPCGGEGEGGGGRPCARWCSAPEPEPDPSNLDPSPNLDPSNLDPSNLDPSPRSCACV